MRNTEKEGMEKEEQEGKQIEQPQNLRESHIGIDVVCVRGHKYTQNGV